MEPVTTTHNVWDDQYREGKNLRWWPDSELVRFLGQTYGTMADLPCISMKALELGSGTGRNLWALREWGFEDYGIDCSAIAIELAKQYLESRWPAKEYSRVRQGSVPESLAHEQASFFDLIVDVQCLQHLAWSQHAGIYLSIKRILKSSGRFFSVHLGSGTTDISCGEGWTDAWTWLNVAGPRAIYPNNGMVCMPPEALLLHAIEDAGLDIESHRQLTRTYPNKGQAEWHVIEARKP